MMTCERRNLKIKRRTHDGLPHDSFRSKLTTAACAAVAIAAVAIPSLFTDSSQLHRSSTILSITFAEAHQTYTVAKKIEVRKTVTELFYHGYNSYMQHAFPKDELKPLSCKGDDTFGGYSLTLIDTLDMLALVGDYPEFMKQVHYVSTNLQYQSRVVSVFETTIRVLGGLITAHQLAIRVCKEKREGSDWAYFTAEERELFTYRGGLLEKARELADLLLPAFDTPTGIPYNELNMRTGTQKSKGHTTCPAGAGSLLLEFGALSVLTGNCTYVAVAERALEGVWKHRSGQSLVGTMIDVFSGKWINGESSIGASIDSFYEYMVKSYMYFGEEKFLDMWLEAYKAVQKYTYFGGWYLSSTVDLLSPIDNMEHKFNSLQAFWPGLQVLAGDVHNALDSWGKMWCIVEKIGLPPEYVDLASFLAGQPQAKRTGGPGYPLRPEFLESTFFLYKATGEERFLEISEQFVEKLAKMRQRCGFAAVVDVYSFTFEDKMDSFVLAETFKYLYLLFTPSDDDVARENAIRRDIKKRRIRSEDPSLAAQAVNDATINDYPSLPEEAPMGRFPLLYTLDDDQYVVNTEAHPLLIDRDSQSIFRKCRDVRENMLLPLNQKQKLRSKYRAYKTVDASLGTRNAWDDKQMCKPVDYMLDIAPFIAQTFYNEGFCAKPPSTRTLGHSKNTYMPAMSYHVMVPKLAVSGKGFTALGERIIDAQIPITVPEDPTVLGSKPLKLFINTRLSVSAGQSPAPPISLHHYGVHSIPVVTNVDSLYLPSNNIFIRKAPAPIVGGIGGGSGSSSNTVLKDNDTKSRDTVEEKRPAEGGTGSVGEGDGTVSSLSSDAAVYSPNDLYVQCSSANFGPTLCEQIKPLNPNILKITHTVHVYRATVEASGCTPEAIGDTSGYKRPFAIAIDRGQCTFKEKALSAQIKGAVLAIIINGGDQLIHMGDSAVDGAVFKGHHVQIPLAMMLRNDESHVLPPRLFEFNEGGSRVPTSATTSKPEPNSAFTEINVICARNAVEQYRLMGLSMLVRANDLLIFRHRLAPLVDAFVAKTAPFTMRTHYTDPLVDCSHCVLAIHESTLASAEEVPPADPINFRPSVGLYGGSFLGSYSEASGKSSSLAAGHANNGIENTKENPMEAPLAAIPYVDVGNGTLGEGTGGSSDAVPSANAVDSKSIMRMRRLQFALAPKRPTPIRFPLISDPHTIVLSGVSYFFGDLKNLTVAEVRRFSLSDPHAFYYYHNRLGSWLETNGDRIGVGASFLSFYDSEKRSAVELTLFTNNDAREKFAAESFESALFTQAQVFRLMRDLFVANVTTELYDLGREHFVMPENV